MFIPYSSNHNWQLHWTNLPSNLKEPKFINDESPKECAALDAIAKVGVIGGAQLFRLFNLGKKRLKNMVRQQKIVRHELQRGNKPEPIYTLGAAGAKITGLPHYEPNYWFEYQIEDVLKSLLFFELYTFFPDAQVIPAANPFIAAIQYKRMLFHIYVIRGDTKDIQLLVKWKQQIVPERIIVLTETLTHAAFLNQYTELAKIRITTDQGLQNRHNSLRNLFYYFNEQGKTMKET